MNELNHIYDDKGNLLAGGNLFSMGSATNDASAITAANISISQAWAEDKVSLQASTKPDAPAVIPPISPSSWPSLTRR